MDDGEKQLLHISIILSMMRRKHDVKLSTRHIGSKELCFASAPVASVPPGLSVRQVMTSETP